MSCDIVICMPYYDNISKFIIFTDHKNILENSISQFQKKKKIKIIWIFIWIIYRNSWNLKCFQQIGKKFHLKKYSQ